MFKEKKIMFIYTETSLHCGSGTGLGVVDLPIQRERYTEFPVCQASGIKGAVREWFEEKDGRDNRKVLCCFGPEFGRGETEAFAGAVTFTDGRILLFPVRSMKEVFAYTTSPFVLNRFKRDMEMAGISINWDLSSLRGNDNNIFGVRDSRLNDSGRVVLEEYSFDFVESTLAEEIAIWLSDNALPQTPEYDFWRGKIKKDLLILPDDAFRDFVRLSTEVQARIRLDSDTKTVDKGALFYEEALPPDSLLYSVVLAHDPVSDSDSLKNSRDVIDYICSLHGNRLHFGGDTTTGKGIIYINFLGGGR